MVDVAPRALHFDLDRVKLSVKQKRVKFKTVLMANEFAYFPIRALEVSLVFGEIDMATRCNGNLM